MVSINLWIILLFIGFVSIEQVTGDIVFKEITADDVGAILNDNQIPDTIRNGPTKFTLRTPWLVANKDNFYVIIYSCECANPVSYPCNGRPFFTFIRLFKYGTNDFLVVTDDMGQPKPLVNVEVANVKTAAENWLNATKITTDVMISVWKDKARDFANFTLNEAKDLAATVYGLASTDNIIPCVATLVGTVTFILMLGPDNNFHAAFTRFISP